MSKLIDFREKPIETIPIKQVKDFRGIYGVYQGNTGLGTPRTCIITFEKENGLQKGAFKIVFSTAHDTDNNPSIVEIQDMRYSDWEELIRAATKKNIAFYQAETN